MPSLVLQIVSWPALGIALLVFGFAPGAVLRLIVLAFPRDDPRRRELLGELYAVPRIERPFWVAEKLELALFEGLRSRIAARRVFDVVVAASMLFLMAPAFAVIALALKITQRGPVFSRQPRIGKGGKPITLLKFRTMAVDAQAPLALTMERYPEGALFELGRDPLVTRMGGWLRRWHFDELPYLLHVLSGDMSLVRRPRPARPAGDHGPRHEPGG